MTCENYELMISEMVDGEPGTGGSGEVFIHMATCPECQRFLHTLLKLRNIEADSMNEESFPQAHTRRISNRPAHGFLRRQVRMSVSSAVIAGVMLILWSVAFTFTISEREAPAVRSGEDPSRPLSMQSVPLPSRQYRSTPNYY